MRKQHRFSPVIADLAALVGSSPAFVAGAHGVDDESTRTAAAVIAVDQHWLEAEVGGDTAWLDRMLLPDYRSVDSKGVAHEKAAIVAHAAKNRGSDRERRQVEAWLRAHPSGKQVVIRGDTAILSFYDPKRGPQRGVRSADIFVYQNGHWHALYSQHSATGGQARAAAPGIAPGCCYQSTRWPSRSRAPLMPGSARQAAATMPAAPRSTGAPPGPPSAVATHPGHTALTRMPLPASSAASTRVNALSAALDTR